MHKHIGIIATGFLIASLPVVATTQPATREATVVATVSPTKTTAPTEAGITEKDVDILKEKIATKVAELRKDSEKGVSGVITDISNEQITLAGVAGSTYTVTRDSALTKVYEVGTTGKKDLAYDDLEKDDYIIVTGPIIDTDISANTIYRDEQFVVISGKVTKVDEEKNIVELVSFMKDTYELSIDRKSTIQLYDVKKAEVVKSTFAKIKEGDMMHATAKKSTEKKTNDTISVVASKALVLPQELLMKAESE